MPSETTQPPSAQGASALSTTQTPLEKPVKKKAIVYHPECFVEGTPNKSHSKESRGYPDSKDSKGYPRAKSKSDDYKRKSSSDEYKRRQYEEEQKNLETQDLRKKYSTNTLLGILIGNVIIMIILTGLIIFISTKEQDMETVTARNGTPHIAVKRRGLAIASDNLDCSILMKRYRMLGAKARYVMQAGLMCLYLHEPHSVAPDSGISMQFHFQHSRTSLADTYEQNLVKSSCKKDDVESANCDLRGFENYRIGFVSIEDKPILDTNFLPRLSINGSEHYLDHYQSFFRLFYHMNDYGNESYPQVKNTKGFNQNRAKMSGVIFNRTIQVSELYETAFNVSNRETPMSTQYLQRLGFKSSASIRTKAKINLGTKLVRHVIDEFLYTNSDKKKAYHPDKTFIKMVMDKYRIAIANGSTMSLITALIIHLVFLQKNVIQGHTDQVEKEANFYAYFMLAQRLAYEEYVINPQFRNGTAFGPKFFKLMADKMKTMKDSKTPPLADMKVRRKNPDRVASILLWTQGTMSSLIMLNAGLPRMFMSNFIHNGTREAYADFSMNGKITPPVTSAAGVILLDKRTAMPLLAVTASGSVRTVDAVATTVLRWLILKEDIGLSANASSIFYDPSDGKFYCDKYFQENSEPSDKIAKILKTPGSLCSFVVKDKFDHNDRIVMAMSKPQEFNSYIEAAVKGIKKNLNYPVGY